MVKKGEFIDFASNLEVEDHTTEFQVIIELSQKIKELEERILKLEKKVK